MGFFDRLKQGLAKTRDALTKKIDTLIFGRADIDYELLDELEETLILADVGLPTTEKLMQAVRGGIKSKEIKSPADLKPFLAREIQKMLEVPANSESKSDLKKILLIVGVNGVGKTTTIGKLSAFYKSEGKSVLLAAADTFRAAAIDQLEIWAKRSSAQFVKHSEGSDPAAVAFDAAQAAVARKIDVLIVDTAGRLQTKSNLMEELKKINRVIDRAIPDSDKETLLVLDAATGQNAISQAKLFTQAVNVNGIILTKLDGTAKGGVILAIHNELNLPVRWIGVGEKIDDLRPFDAGDFSKALFNLE
ncbi:MAG: signal recognition particle-docking protein FtsY [Selenomonadaceae bacterium]|nr:signal recognition particle-docking protein FtsY [Selenomonadaceae bacterium]